VGDDAVDDRDSGFVIWTKRPLILAMSMHGTGKKKYKEHSFSVGVLYCFKYGYGSIPIDTFLVG